jgi:hypothetical protein
MFENRFDQKNYQEDKFGSGKLPFRDLKKEQSPEQESPKILKEVPFDNIYSIPNGMIRELTTEEESGPPRETLEEICKRSESGIVDLLFGKSTEMKNSYDAQEFENMKTEDESSRNNNQIENRKIEEKSSTRNNKTTGIQKSMIFDEATESQNLSIISGTMKQDIIMHEFDKLLEELSKDKDEPSKKHINGFLIDEVVADNFSKFFQFGSDHEKFLFENIDPLHFSDEITESIERMAQNIKVGETHTVPFEEESMGRKSSLPRNFALVTGFVVKSDPRAESTQSSSSPTREAFESRKTKILEESKLAFENDLPKFIKENKTQSTKQKLLI